MTMQKLRSYTQYSTHNDMPKLDYHFFDTPCINYIKHRPLKRRHLKLFIVEGRYHFHYILFVFTFVYYFQGSRDAAQAW